MRAALSLDGPQAQFPSLPARLLTGVAIVAALSLATLKLIDLSPTQPSPAVVTGQGGPSAAAPAHPFGALVELAPTRVPVEASAPIAQEPATAPQPVLQKPSGPSPFGGLFDFATRRAADLAAAEQPKAPAAEPAPLPPRRSAARTAQPAEVAAAPAAPAPDNRGLFERLFNIGGSTSSDAQKGPALAYARPEDGAVGNALRDANRMPMGYDDGHTAVYDISAKAVFLPNGEKLEAHSGLGDMLDDPSRINVKNRGPTPPNVYELSLRESLFHGVRALRMNPVGGSAMYGRDGILAHTYMLGPRGDSNGCVSFKDYDRFLQAFLNGQVKRLIVVTKRA